MAQGVVLAAGLSRRMGHPKALSLIDGQPAARVIVDACRAAGLDDVIVVAPPGLALPPLDARVIVNPDPDAGRTGSLQLALAPAPAPAPVLAWPVDHPLATSATARRLLGEPGSWVVPTMGARAGHPIVLRGDALDAVRKARPDAPLRDVLRDAGIEQVRVPVEDPGVLLNLDEPGDLASLNSGTRLRRA